MIHSLARLNIDQENIDLKQQTVGSFLGFQAQINKECTPSKAHYYLSLPKPPHKSAINEVMMRLVEIIKNKNMPFLLLTGDQPVYTIIVQLKNEQPSLFEKIIPFLGPFHAQCSFITSISKRFSGSGLSELIVSSDMIADKSVDAALRGKHYKRIVRTLQLTYEALQRRIIKIGIENGCSLPPGAEEQLNILRNAKHHSKDALIYAAEHLRQSDTFQTYMSEVYNIIESSNSPMAQYWLSFMSMVEILMMNIHSVRTGNWKLFLDSIRLMIPWMKIYDKNKYGMWLTEFWSEMSSLPQNISQKMSELFANSITGDPYTRLPLDMWIEMTMNKGSKMKAGWKQILKNEKMLLSQTRNVNNINKIRTALNKIADLKITKSGIHKENGTRRLKADEECVHNIQECLEEFGADPFNLTNTVLRTLHSGEIASKELGDDLAAYLDDGEMQLTEFMEQRIFSRETKFNATVHKNNRATFTKPPTIAKGSIKKMKTAEMENKAMANVVTMCCQEKAIPLVDVLKHRITEECLSIFNTNGTMVKIQKSKLLEMLEWSPMPHSKLQTCLSIIDMGFIWRLCTPTAEDREKDDGTVYSWEDYSKKVFKTVLSRHPTAKTLILVNDPYTNEVSIKDSEHRRREEACHYVDGSRNMFIKPNEKFPAHKEFKEFFTNKSNKIRLQEFLKKGFNTEMRGRNITMIYSTQSECWDLESGERRPEYECLHAEADTIMFYTYSQLRKSGVKDTVIIDAEDTDVVALSAKVAHEVEGDLGIKRKKEVFSCKHLCDQSMASIIIPLHCQTGSDFTSGFFGHSKKSVMKQMQNSDEIAEYMLLAEVGQNIPIQPQVQRNLEKFTIKVVYNDKSSRNLDEARTKKWNDMKRKSTQRLPPNSDSHKHHATRVNFISYMFSNYDKREGPPSPLSNGWNLEDGKHNLL